MNKGYVSTSMGPVKIPILLYNNRSSGGRSILTHCIVQIKESKTSKILYQHPNHKSFVELQNKQ